MMINYNDFELEEIIALETGVYRYEVNPNEHKKRLTAKLPVLPPKFRPGEFVYSSFHDANVPVVAVYWDAGYGRKGWTIHTPGFGGFEDSLSRARANAKTLIYMRTDNGNWKNFAFQEPIEG